MVTPSETAPPLPDPPPSGWEGERQGGQDPASITGALSQLMKQAGGILGDGLDLVALDTQLALASLIRLLVLAIFMAVLLVASWFALVTSLVLWWMNAEQLPWSVFAVVLLVNLLLAAGIYGAMRHLSRNLKFRATRKQLQSYLGSQDDTGASSAFAERQTETPSHAT